MAEIPIFIELHTYHGSMFAINAAEILHLSEDYGSGSTITMRGKAAYRDCLFARESPATIQQMIREATAELTALRGALAALTATQGDGEQQ